MQISGVSHPSAAELRTSWYFTFLHLNKTLMLDCFASPAILATMTQKVMLNPHLKIPQAATGASVKCQLQLQQ